MGAAPLGPRLGSAVVIVEGERVLLGVRAKDPHRGCWVLPGGKIRPFESIASAAEREVAEETGLQVCVAAPFAVREIIDPPDEHRVVIFSFGQVVAGTPRPGSDLSQVRFWHREDLDQLPMTETVRAVLTTLDWKSMLERDTFEIREGAASPSHARAISSP